MKNTTFNPCDECKYGIDRRDGSGSDRMCKICEFSDLLNRRAQQENKPLACHGCVNVVKAGNNRECVDCCRRATDDHYRSKLKEEV